MEKSGNIYVVEAEDNFKRVHKSIIENKNIDCETLGIYTRIIVLGAKWNLNIKGLSTHLDISDSKIRKSISVLEREGYIVRTAVRGEGGRFFGWDYKILPIPIEESQRSSAGKPTSQKTDTRCYGQVGSPTTRLSDNTVNVDDNSNIINNTNNNKLKGIINLNKNKSKDDDFAERMYSIYPSKCPCRNASLGKCSKDKDRIKRLLKTYTKEQIEAVIRNEVETKYGKSYMQNFSTFLNNFPDPNCLFDNNQNKADAESKDDKLIIDGVEYQ